MINRVISLILIVNCFIVCRVCVCVYIKKRETFINQLALRCLYLIELW